MLANLTYLATLCLLLSPNTYAITDLKDNEPKQITESTEQAKQDILDLNRIEDFAETNVSTGATTTDAQPMATTQPDVDTTPTTQKTTQPNEHSAQNTNPVLDDATMNTGDTPNTENIALATTAPVAIQTASPEPQRNTINATEAYPENTITTVATRQPEPAPTPRKTIVQPQTKTTPENIHATSPWENFLINTISVLHYSQNQAQHYFSVLFSKQGIPLLIIVFGVLILNMVVWFAYISFKKEQAQKIKNVMQNKSVERQAASDQPEPLSLAYAEESSGDYDVFATSEGIPIKLDLAQAYVNMGDIDNAKVILEDIIQQHRGKIVQSAQAMLKKITAT